MDQLENIFWHCLHGPQSHLAIGSGAVRRLAPGYCPIAGFEQAGVPDFAALETICAPGEQLYCVGWRGRAPDGWRVDAESTTHCLLWEAPIPANDPAPDAEKLGPENAAAAVELAQLGGVGPFGLRSIELGDYFGYFHDGRLVAMAGELFAADGLREISGVCTHPDFFTAAWRGAWFSSSLAGNSCVVKNHSSTCSTITWRRTGCTSAWGFASILRLPRGWFHARFD
jgi:hypothetical protein